MRLCQKEIGLVEIMAILKDCFSLHPFHRLMHGRWYHLHKTHHEVNENSQCMLALNIDFLDIILENIAAANLMLLLKHLLGLPVALNVWSIFLIEHFDVHIHSVNPYTSSFFFFPLDYLFRANVAHNVPIVSLRAESLC